jgi:hypothetical protein
MQRYRALRTIATVFRILAWIVLVLGVIGSIVVAVMAEGAAAAVLVLIAGLFGTAIYFLILFAAAGAIYVVIDIEQNTRDTVESLRQRG